MESKQWYLSKLVWLGVIQTLLGVLAVVSDFLQSGRAFDAAGVVLIATGILTVILRVWFTDTEIS
jgi:hypothetical protein